MAGDWIKVRADLLGNPKTAFISKAIGADAKDTLIKLYLLAEWVSKHGMYGRVKCRPEIIDQVSGSQGMARALISVGWLREFEKEIIVLGFYKPHTERKSLGKAIRKKLLSSGACAKCGSSQNLEIDHIIPIFLGGSSEIENLQVLCFSCNRTKGAKHGG